MFSAASASSSSLSSWTLTGPRPTASEAGATAAASSAGIKLGVDSAGSTASSPVFTPSSHFRASFTFISFFSHFKMTEHEALLSGAVGGTRRERVCTRERCRRRRRRLLIAPPSHYEALIISAQLRLLLPPPPQRSSPPPPRTPLSPLRPHVLRALVFCQIRHVIQSNLTHVLLTLSSGSAPPPPPLYNLYDRARGRRRRGRRVGQVFVSTRCPRRGAGSTTAATRRGPAASRAARLSESVQEREGGRARSIAVMYEVALFREVALVTAGAAQALARRLPPFRRAAAAGFISELSHNKCVRRCSPLPKQ